MRNSESSRSIDPAKTVAEKLNGRLALIGIFALLGAYSTTGQIIPGFIWILIIKFSPFNYYSDSTIRKINSLQVNLLLKSVCSI